MDAPGGSQTSRTLAELRLVGLLSLVHIAASIVIWATAAHVVVSNQGLIISNQVAVGRDFLFLGFTLGQLTLAATWLAYGTPRLVVRALVASLLVVVGGVSSMAAHRLNSGPLTPESWPYLAVGIEWCLIVAATLISIRWLCGRRIVHELFVQPAGSGAPQLSLRQLLALPAVWALPLAVPGLLAPDAEAAAGTILICVVLFPFVMGIAAPLMRAALSRRRLRRNLVLAAAVVMSIITVESLVLAGMLLQNTPPAPISKLMQCLWGIGGLLAFNGAIALAVLPTMLVVRARGYWFAERRSAEAQAESAGAEEASDSFAVRSAA